jgi:hypothetical protein
VRAHGALDVDRGDARRADGLRACEHEVGVAVAVRVLRLDVEDAALGGAAVRRIGRTAGGLNVKRLGRDRARRLPLRRDRIVRPAAP